MRQKRLGFRLLAGCWLAFGLAPSSPAADKVAPQQILAYRPRQEVQISTPTTEADIAACKVEVVSVPGGGNAWLLRDGNGRPLRKIADTKGTRKPDTYSYYLDGVEVYREIDSNQTGKPDQFRWLNSGGTRWGVDVNGDGIIDGWRQISVEEVGQEILRAVATRNVLRLQALAISEAEIKQLELPTDEAARIRQAVAALPAKFKELVAKANLTEQTQWVQIESQNPPQCLAADQTGGKTDVIRYRSCRILHATQQAKGDPKHEWLQTGELIQIGRAWRVVSGPSLGHGEEEVAANPGQGAENAGDPAINALLTQLQELDKNAPRSDDGPAVVKYNFARAALLTQIANKSKSDQQEQWVKQVADCYSAAVQTNAAGSADALKALVTLRDQFAKGAPGSALAGYIAFREMTADYAVKMSGAKGADIAKIQDAWQGKLKSFVEAYPSAEDAPDALNQLGIIGEFAGKEDDAKKWYEVLAGKYGKHPLGEKGAGALRRLNSDGKEFQLASTQLNSNAPFNVAALRGKTVVVYYWASWNSQCAQDLFKLMTLTKAFNGPTGLQVVTVNLDNDAAAATAFLQKNPSPGIHLFEKPGGLDGALAKQYGVNVLPQLFLIGRDGKVVSHTVQMSSVEDELKKLLSPGDKPDDKADDKKSDK